LAAELVRRKVAVIIGFQTPTVPTSPGEFRSFLGGCRVARQPIRDSKRAAAGLNPRRLL
jgi:hypothetical protein